MVLLIFHPKCALFTTISHSTQLPFNLHIRVTKIHTNKENFLVLLNLLSIVFYIFNTNSVLILKNSDKIICTNFLHL